MTELKNWRTEETQEKLTTYLTTKIIVTYYDLRHYKANAYRYAEPWQRYRMHQIAALAGIKRHVWTPGSDVLPILGAHISVVKFQYPNLIWKESCGNMAVSTPKSGVSVVLNAEFNHSKRRLQPLKTAVLRSATRTTSSRRSRSPSRRRPL